MITMTLTSVGNKMIRQSNDFKDFYDTLGVASSATTEEVKQAYRRLARKYHPDVSNERDAEERFKKIQRAYSVLNSPIERRYYDQVRRNKAGEMYGYKNATNQAYWATTQSLSNGFFRKSFHFLMVLFWLCYGFFCRLFRVALVTMLMAVTTMIEKVAGLMIVPFLIAGLVFEGNPFVLKTWSVHPEMAFVCFGLPLTVLLLSSLLGPVIQWLAQDGPLFQTTERWIDSLRYKTLSI